MLSPNPDKKRVHTYRSLIKKPQFPVEQLPGPSTTNTAMVSGRMEVFTTEDPEVRPKTVRDRSMLWCFGSLLLFAFLTAVILLALVLSRLDEDAKQYKKIVGEENNFGTTNAQIGFRSNIDDDIMNGASTDRTGTNRRGKVVKAESEITVGESLPPPASDDEDNHVVAPVCSSEECKKEASTISSLRGLSYDPCKDFYNYSCGGLHDNAFLSKPGPYARYLAKLSAASETIDQNIPGPKTIYKKYLESCLNFPNLDYQEKVNSLKNIFKRAGKFYSSEDWSGELRDLTKPLSSLLLINIAPYFDVGVEPEIQGDEVTYVLTLTPTIQPYLWPSAFGSTGRSCSNVLSQFTSPNIRSTVLRPLGRKEAACKDQKSKYMETTKKALKILSNFGDDPSVLEDILDSLQWDVVEALSPEKSKLQDAKEEEAYGRMTVEELQQRFSDFVNWRDLFSELTSNDVKNDAIVHVYLMGYFEILHQRIKLFQRKFNNQLLSILAHELYTRFLLPPDISQQEFCLQQSSKLMKDVSSAIYLETFSDNEIQDALIQIEKSFNTSKNLLSRQFDEDSGCLNDFLRKDVEKKLNSIKLETEIADIKSLSWTIIKSTMTNISPGIGFIEDTLMWIRRERELLFGLWGENARRPDLRWITRGTSALTDITYLRQTKTVFVPLQYLEDIVRDRDENLAIYMKFDFHMARAVAASFVFSDVYTISSPPDYFFERKLYLVPDEMQQIRSTYSNNLRLAEELALRSVYGKLFGSDYKFSGFYGVPDTPKQQLFMSLMQQSCAKSPEEELFNYMSGEDDIPQFIRFNTDFPKYMEFLTAFNCPLKDYHVAPIICIKDN